MNISHAEAKRLGIPVEKRHRDASRPAVAKGPAYPLFPFLCTAHNLPVPEPEYRFNRRRMWRLDFLFPAKVAIEVQGGNHVGGRHTRGAALSDEYDKVNAAQVRGFIVLFFTPDQLSDGSCIPTIKAALRSRGIQL